MKEKVLVIACGAIARELVHIRKLSGWDHIELQCLPPELHNSPDLLPAAVKVKIESQRAHFKNIFVAYGDCGTGGALDKVLDDYSIQRIAGAHCYEFFAGSGQFNAIAETEAGTFYLTDFLVRHFEKLVIRGLGMDRLPELIPMYFANYKRVVYLAQIESEELISQARSHAEFLGLDFEYHLGGHMPLCQALAPDLAPEQNISH